MIFLDQDPVEIGVNVAGPSFSVVHLAMRKGDNHLSVGSGVLYRKGVDFYIATAWHNVSGRNSISLRPLSKHAVVPDNVVVSVARGAPGLGMTRASFVVPIESEDKTHYLIHPQRWPRVDVVAIPVDPNAPYCMEVHLPDDTIRRMQHSMNTELANPPTKMNVQPIQDCIGSYRGLGATADQLVEPGDDLFVLGYPRGIADYTMEPIWKRATVASRLQPGWEGQSKFLIDCASREGMSGAPVIAHSKNGTVSAGNMRFMGGHQNSALLMGIYVGRVIDIEASESDRLFEASVGTVWKTAVIDEIIEAGIWAPHSDELVASGKEIAKAVQAVWPSDEEHHEKVLAHDAYRWGMVRATLAQLQGRANPTDVEEAVVFHAENLRDQLESL